MADVTEVKETSTTEDSNPAVVRETTTVDTRRANGRATAHNVAYFILGVIEVLLAIRFVLRLFGASPASGFVNLIYSLSDILLAPFVGIFSSATTKGAETVGVFEPATVVAMIIYALVFWGIVKLIEINQKRV